MTDHWSQRAPLTGVLFAVLVAASVVANNSYTPKASARAPVGASTVLQPAG